MAQSNLAPMFKTRDVMQARLRDLRRALETQGVRRVWIFGSVARGDDVPESDLDIVVDVDPDRHIGLFQIAEIQEFLEKALGRHVDLATRAGLRPGRHDEILADLFDVF